MYLAKKVLSGSSNINQIEILTTFLIAYNTTSSTDKDKANLLARYYAPQFSHNPRLAEKDHPSRVSEIVRRFLVNLSPHQKTIPFLLNP